MSTGSPTVIVLHATPAPPALPPFPTRRSSDLRERPRSALRPRVSPRATSARAHHSRNVLRAGPSAPAGVPSFEHHRPARAAVRRSEEHTSELQSLRHLVCRLLLEKKKTHTVST